MKNYIITNTINNKSQVEMMFSSFGFRSQIMREKFSKIIPQGRALKEKNCLIIPYAGFNTERTIELEKCGLIEFGFDKEKIISAKDDMLTNPSFVPDYIYVPGGDPFKLLSEIRKRKLYSRIRRLVLTNKTSYIGVSAGAYIASKSIEYVKQLEDDDYEENEYRALGLVSNPIICHSDHYMHSQIKSCEIIAMAKSILIRDDQLVHLKSDNWHYIE